MQFTVSNNGTQWTLDFGPDSVVLNVKQLDEYLIISSLENPLSAWSLLLSQRKEFLDNHLPRVPIAPNQQGTFEMREEALSSVGAQETRYRHAGIRAIRSRRHLVQLGTSFTGYGQCSSTWN